MRQHIANLPDKDLAYFEEGAQHFDDYVEAVNWAQEYAMHNRKLMMEQLIEAVTNSGVVQDAILVITHMFARWAVETVRSALRRIATV